MTEEQHDPNLEEQHDPPLNLVWMGAIVEGGLALLAIFLAWWGLYDHRQKLSEIDLPLMERSLIWGVVTTIPLLIYLIVFHFLHPKFLRPMQDFVVEQLYPIFRGRSLFELLVLSLMAGFCEELLFRWSLQGGLTTILESRAGLLPAQIIGLLVASILFGLCHWVNSSYGLTTLMVGLYLGFTMIWFDTFLVPAIAHALFDFVALIYISRMASSFKETASQQLN